MLWQGIFGNRGIWLTACCGYSCCGQGRSGNRGIWHGDELTCVLFCAQYLDLRPDAMAAVATAMGGDATVEELSKTVEELSRLH